MGLERKRKAVRAENFPNSFTDQPYHPLQRIDESVEVYVSEL